jgi:hypothetical protein
MENFEKVKIQENWDFKQLNSGNETLRMKNILLY